MNQSLAIREDVPLMELGKVLAQSGYFIDARDANQAIVKVLAGREMGFGPIASMTGIYIVKGKPSMGANLIAAAIKRSGRYDYRVKELTDEVCRIEFLENINGKRESIGVSEFTKAQAAKAGTQNMDKFPRNMLFARTMSNGAKWFCADVFGGPVYTPDELGAVVDGETGEVIDNTVTETVKSITYDDKSDDQSFVEAQTTQAVKKVSNGAKHERPYTPEVLYVGIQKVIKNYEGRECNDKQRGLVAGMIEACFAGDMESDNKRHSVTQYLIGVESLREATGPQILALLDWLKPSKDEGGAYLPDGNAVREAQTVIIERMKELGQDELPM